MLLLQAEGHLVGGLWRAFCALVLAEDFVGVGEDGGRVDVWPSGHLGEHRFGRWNFIRFSELRGIGGYSSIFAHESRA